MIVKDIVDLDFVNYKKPSMFILMPFCSFKCEKECGIKCCQNTALANKEDIDIGVGDIIERYTDNPMTEAIVFGGMEPFDSMTDLYYLITCLRNKTEDDIVIYTGYTENELKEGYYDNMGRNISLRRVVYEKLIAIPNIIIKYGRYIPNSESHFDDTLGVTLASPNQYAMRYEK